MRELSQSLVILVTLAGCASSSSGAGDPPVSCDRGKRAGTYLLHFTTVSGDCGETGDTLVNLSDTAPTAGCKATAPDVWSEGDCKIERALTCTVDGRVVHYVGYSRQTTTDGSQLSGELSITIDGPGGCSGTYSLSYRRQ